MCAERSQEGWGKNEDSLGFPEKIRNLQAGVQLDTNSPFQLLLLDMFYGDDWVDC